MGSATPLVGRVREWQLLEEAAARARTGEPSALIVHGEPGVGKTRLVTEFVAGLDGQRFRVLSGRCVRFAAESSSYLPIAQALGTRLELTDPGSGMVLHRVGEVFAELMGSGPVALVVDDLQWADLSSLDVLTYLVAGFAPGQRLLLMGSHRDTELGAGHPLHTWLADMRRMPGVSFLPLRRFDRHDTELLVDSLLGDRTHARLAADAFERSDGNPYLIELLVRDLEPTAEGLPAALPGDLRQALLAAWHRLSAPTRELIQVLAVGGRPVDVAVLVHVAGAGGVDADKVRAGVVEATEAGLAVVNPDGSVWFHHPLVAEVLVSTLLPPEAARMHAEYVAVWLAATGVPEHVRAAHLALHCEASGDLSAALVWSLRSAAEAERIRGYSEESQHVVRACRLWPVADDAARVAAGEYLELLLRATRAANRAGEFDTALTLGERAYRQTDGEQDPLLACRVLNELNQLRTMHRTDWSLTQLREAVDLSSGYPESPEHARALALLGWEEQWLGLPEAIQHVEAALTAARGCGSDEALAQALYVAANLGWGQAESLTLAEEALQLSRRIGDPTLIEHSAVILGNCLEGMGRVAEVGPFTLEVYEELVRIGAPHGAGVMAARAARELFYAGSWQRCRALLRDAMSVRMTTYWTVLARLFAAELAACTGEPSAAQQHLDRAEEVARAAGEGLDPTQALARPPRWRFHAWVVAGVLAAQGKHREAIDVIIREMEVAAHVDRTHADHLLTIAASCTADLVEDDPTERGEANTKLDQLEAVRTSAGAMFEPLPSGDPLPAAHQALYVAHRARAAGNHGDIDAWQAAVDACDHAGLRWEAAQARFRLAAAVLNQRGGHSRAAAALREALRIAVDLGAEPLRTEIEALALQSHITLADSDAEAARKGAFALNGLTKREQEVLGQVVTGRTYAEIAAELFISEKTVSVHVSNLLRKTGTANRIELAALARRRRTGQ